MMSMIFLARQANLFIFVMMGCSRMIRLAVGHTNVRRMNDYVPTVSQRTNELPLINAP